MFGKIFFSVCMCLLLSIVITCENGDGPTGTGTPPDTTETPDTNETLDVYGAVNVILRENADPVTAGILIAFKDGPTPREPWDTVESEGNLHLLVPARPYCEDCDGECVAEDSCELKPKAIGVGDLAVSGMKNSSGSTSFTIKAIANTRYSGSLTYPPCGAGETVTVTAAGTDSIPSFTLTGKGIDPLHVNVDSTLLCEDGKPIEFTWEPPAAGSDTKIHIKIDVSYHGGTKAKIEGTTDDNGSLVVSANLLDKLKSYGINGFPRLDITRISKFVDTKTHVEFTIESIVMIYLDIPGVISCNDDSDCESRNCVNRRCQP